MRPTPWTWTLALLATSPALAADGRPPAIDPASVLARFPVARGGDGLIIPVRIGGRDRPFLVDTGSSNTVLDQADPPGRPDHFETARTSRGSVKFPVYRAPEATVGGIALEVPFVGGLDLQQIRLISGRPIEGILGLDFLGRHVLHLDCDRGELLLLKAAPADAGEALPMTWEDGEEPTVDLWLASDRKIPFLIDTGAIGTESGSVEVMEMRGLVKSGAFREVGSALNESASGTSRSRIYRGDRAWIGGFAVDRPIFDESPGGSKLGLNFWSRFVTTLDFPRRRVWLRRGGSYDHPDRHPLSGLHLIQQGSEVVVHSIDPDSPAAKAGIHPHDAVLSLGDRPAIPAELFHLRKALGEPGPASILVRRRWRGEQAFRLDLKE